jgi:HSP20 family protein
MTTMTRFLPFRAPLQDVAVLQNWLNSIFHDFAMPSNGMQTESLAAGNCQVPPASTEADGNLSGWKT